MRSLFGGVILVTVGLIQPVHADSREHTLDAMQAEIERSRSQLKLEGFDAPYFIGYRLVDEHHVQVEANFGSLTGDQKDRSRRAAVDVRVGDYSFDSSPDADHSLSLDYDTFTPSANAPLTDDPSGLRATLWLLTDTAYKEALGTFLRKKAKAVNRVKKVHVDSLSREVATRAVEPRLTPTVDREGWKLMVGRLSKRFRNQAKMLVGEVSFGLRHTRTFIANSEGARIVKERAIYQLIVNAATRAPDGLMLEQGRTKYFRSLKQLPDMKSLETMVDDVIKDLMALRAAPVADPYTGPAILESEASGVFFHETIGHRLEGERQNDDSEGQTFKGQLGKRILPDFISITDDPTLTTMSSHSLNGHYTFDDQGVPAQKVELIANGILKTFLTSRTPIEKVAKSNGHGRAQRIRRPVARMGNLLVKSERQVDRKELKAMLIAEAKRQKKPYGLIIADITGGSTNTSNYGYQAFKGTPRMVYRVDAETGVETLVRGVEMVGTPLTAINKIVATGKSTGVFNGYCGAESGYVPVSAIAPSVLFKEIELQRTKREKRRMPVLKAPWQE